MENMVFCVVGRLSKTKAEYEMVLRQKGAKDVKKRLTKSVTHVLVSDEALLSSKVRNALSGRVIVDESWLHDQPFVCEPESMTMLKFNVTLAKKYKDQDVDGWYCSEKLDGIRAVWDGYQFWSRSGNPLNVPKEFVSGFPQVTLDGELFGGRGNFDKTSGLVRKKVPDYSEWGFMEFKVFDCPDMATLPFEERFGYLKKLFNGMNHPHLKLCEQVKISKDHIAELLSAVIDEGGEGLMLRNPDSLYEFKRSSSLLKVKQTHDAEAVIIGYESGTGKYRGKCGSLICEYHGKMFKCGSGLSDNLRANPPKIGSRITFGYFEIGVSGVPRFPTFKRLFSQRP